MCKFFPVVWLVASIGVYFAISSNLHKHTGGKLPFRRCMDLVSSRNPAEPTADEQELYAVIFRHRANLYAAVFITILGLAFTPRMPILLRLC
jgi:hypothetical protein